MKNFSADCAIWNLTVKQINSLTNHTEFRKAYACKGHSITADDY